MDNDFGSNDANLKWYELFNIQDRLNKNGFTFAETYMCKNILFTKLDNLATDILEIQKQIKQNAELIKLNELAMREFESSKKDSKKKYEAAAAASSDEDNEIMQEEDYDECRLSKIRLTKDNEALELKLKDSKLQINILREELVALKWVDAQIATSPSKKLQKNQLTTMRQGDINSFVVTNVAAKSDSGSSILVVKVYRGFARLSLSNQHLFNKTKTFLNSQAILTNRNYETTGLAPLLRADVFSKKASDGKPEQYLSIAYPYFANGNIRNSVAFIKSNASLKLSDEFLYTNITRIINTLTSLAEQQIHHLHIKPENLLLSSCGSHVLLSDLVATDFILTAYANVGISEDAFSAPELYSTVKLTKHFINNNNLNYLACDLFSLGLCFYYILTKKEVSTKMHKNEQFLLDCLCDIKTDCEKTETLVKRLLSWNPEDRLTKKQVFLDIVNETFSKFFKF